jgi:hypothetical protein
VRVPSGDLDAYDARLAGTGRGSLERRMSGSMDEGSRRGAALLAALEPVPEAEA